MKIDGSQLGGLFPDSTTSKPGAAPASPEQTPESSSARRAAKLGYQDSEQAAAEAQASLASGSDQVALSGLGQELNRLARADSQHRETRVDKLAADYSAGRLPADAGAVAKKIVDDAFSND